MAICLRRNFKSCSSFAYVGRRNRQTNYVNQKPLNSDPPFFKEPPPLEYSPLNIVLRGNPRAMKNFQTLSESVLCAQECKAYKEVPKDPEGSLGRPDKDQLDHITKILIDDLPKIFVKTMNYSVYHPEIIFENNIRGTKTKGLLGYIKEITMFRLIGHIRFAFLNFVILKITAHPEDGTVRVRWRVTGVPNYKAFFSFLKVLGVEKISEREGWYDGFSIYFVRSDGLIHKHTVDKMIPDSEEKVSNMRNDLAAKMAFTVGLTIKGLQLNCERTQQDFFNVTCPSKINRTHSEKSQV